jgi:hypothetical protein
MFDALCDRVWGHSQFHSESEALLRYSAAIELDIDPPEKPSLGDVQRLLNSAAILSSSKTPLYRARAINLASNAFKHFSDQLPGAVSVLATVIYRTGNFPAVSSQVDALSTVALPSALAVEVESRRDGNTKTVGGRDVALTDFQVNLMAQLLSRRSVGVSAPTSAGKSFVIQGYLSELASQPEMGHVIYLVPSRALIAQVSRDIAGWLGTGSSRVVPVLTTPVAAEDILPASAFFVMTQERLSSTLLNQPTLKANTIVVDEAQSIHDVGRGVLLSNVLSEMYSRAPQAQFIFAGPEIKNPRIFGEFFGLSGFAVEQTSDPAVIQNLILVDTRTLRKSRELIVTNQELGKPLGTRTVGQPLSSSTDKLVHSAYALTGNSQSLVYANGPAMAEKIALGLHQLESEMEIEPRNIELAKFIREAVHPKYLLAETVRSGVGFHYGRIPALVRAAIEDAFSIGDIRYLATTSTLLQGVNLPAKNLFICDPRKGQKDPLEPAEFWNLAGRAGRLGKEFHGNVFLIDYPDWKSKPLEDDRRTEVTPALARHLTNDLNDLLNAIEDVKPPRETDQLRSIETTFSRLLSDYRSSKLDQTLSRSGVSSENQKLLNLSLKRSAGQLTVPWSVIKQSPTVSAHRQQRLYDVLLKRASEGDVDSLIPEHPRDSNAFESYQEIFKICHTSILGVPDSDRSHRYFALLAVRWMSGDPLPQIIDKTFEYSKTSNLGTHIREILSQIEVEIRFRYVRLMSCYTAVLGEVLSSQGRDDAQKSIPSVGLYLEVGASDRTMLSLITLGLSRITARKLNDLATNKNLDTELALRWLQRLPIDSLDFSEVLRNDVRRIAESRS